MKVLKNLYNRFFRKKTPFYNYLYQILGFYPENLSFYKLAFQHKSKFKESNERLEFLGDSILDALISDEIYFRFPEKSEGQLSKLRSKIASRTFLNKTGKKLGLQNFLQFKLNQIPIEETNMIGNAFESLIGAIYLDGGYTLAEQFLKNEIFEKHINWSEIESKTVDFKSKMMHFAQKNAKTIEFDIVKESYFEANKMEFEVVLKIDGKEISRGVGSNKKKAQQVAAEKALVLLAM